MAKIHKMRLHVVSVFGEVCPDFSFSASDIALAVGGKAVALSHAWQQDQNFAGDYWALINDKKSVASLGRDIAVSSGWNDEPVIPVVIEQPTGHLPVTVERLVHAIKEISAHAKNWGADLIICFHSFSLAGTDLKDQVFVENLSRQAGGDFGGEIDVSASSELSRVIESHLWVRSVVPMVQAFLVEAGFLPRHEKAVEKAVIGVISRIKQNGFYIRMGDAHRNSEVARKVANAILREVSWEH